MASTELAFWRESIRQWYPDVLNNCYFVPPLHFCHESLAVSTVCGQQAVVHVPVSDDDPNHRVQNAHTALPQVRVVFTSGDETCLDSCCCLSGSNLFQDFCTKLLTTVPGLHLWAAAIRQGHRPTLLHLETLTHPLRCPPSVVREVQQAEEMQNNDVLQYAEDVTLTSPTDGPTVTWLLHGGQQHGGAHPEYCEECGMATADYLRNKLNVGKSAQGADSPPPVSYRDVLILCPSARDDQETKVASPFIRGLRKKDLPVQVAGEDARDDVVRDVALAERDVVTVSHWRNVHGLERKVVVGMAADVSVYHRLQQMSRCTAQLVWICSGGRHCNHLHH